MSNLNTTNSILKAKQEQVLRDNRSVHGTRGFQPDIFVGCGFGGEKQANRQGSSSREEKNLGGAFEDDEEGDTSGAESRDVESSPSRDCSSTSFGDREADELCDLLKSRVECPEFLEKLELECAQLPGSQNIDANEFSWGGRRW
ncbi:hypothetical protein NC653_004918 [Populus alba x Populus x berolinensis]|uniref:Uncharacterized protein n=1 Tax=Populus alba x Populus x berolinensis TaxID=444605 RepID=A0AAD6RAR8_9ROSI|nr:hypothetical protein NC653_004918 [Populus alba x Populus x berolinensis]